MNYYDSDICQRLKTLVTEAEGCINFLYTVPCIYIRSILLNQLMAKIDEINILSGIICSQVNQMKAIQEELPPQPQQWQRELTVQELTEFNGKDGNPAYVAVNGTVYDVTNNAAWAAASHFGLTAGKDLTGEFASCHAGQTILSKLKVVGKLIG